MAVVVHLQYKEDVKRNIGEKTPKIYLVISDSIDMIYTKQSAYTIYIYGTCLYTSSIHPIIINEIVSDIYGKTNYSQTLSININKSAAQAHIIRMHTHLYKTLYS